MFNIKPVSIRPIFTKSDAVLFMRCFCSGVVLAMVWVIMEGRYYA
jgi:hypothetical protein